MFESVRKFREWRKSQGLSPAVSDTYNILYGDPATVAPEAYRIDLCASIGDEPDPCGTGIVISTIPAGRCAMLEHRGGDDFPGEGIRYLLSVWLPSSGERTGGFPLFLQRVIALPGHPESVPSIRIFLPLAQPVVSGTLS